MMLTGDMASYPYWSATQISYYIHVTRSLYVCGPSSKDSTIKSGRDIKGFEHLPTGQVPPKFYLPATWKSVYYTEYHMARPENELARRASGWQILLAHMDIQLAPGNTATINVAPRESHRGDRWIPVYIMFDVAIGDGAFVLMIQPVCFSSNSKGHSWIGNSKLCLFSHPALLEQNAAKISTC